MADPTVNIPIDLLMGLARSAAGPALRAMGRKLESEIKQTLSVAGHGEPSRPGDPPHKQTGELRDSVYSVVDTANLRVNVVVGHPAAFYLEYGTARMGARPFVRNTVAGFAQRFSFDTVQVFFGARHSDFDIQ